jgi:hypothetical protein
MKKQINSTINAQLPRGACYLLLLLAVCAIPFALAQRSSILTGTASHPAALELTFSERVAYQTAIEDVYWRHRIWPDTNLGSKPPLDKVMSQADIGKKVTDYLRNSQALEDYWQKPVTAEQLRAEMERMASHTRQPEVLQELFDALGNDPFVIAECLARPILTERLTADLLAQDKAGRFESLRTAELQVPGEVAAIDSMAKAVQVNRPYQLPVIASPSSGCTDDTWTATTLSNAPSARNNHTAVWTGSEMIIWGGGNTGGRYNPSTDSWTATSVTNAPSARSAPAVWTGTEMIVWGGSDSVGDLNTGGRYNPSTDTWTATSVRNAIARSSHTAVWTGSEMIVWGGFEAGGGDTNTGARYDPIHNRWTPTSTNNAPSPRWGHTAVWTGSEMIVVCGYTSGNTGGRYNPSTDSWTATSTTNAAGERVGHTAVWTGSEMIIWGGNTNFNTGARYNPSTDSWTATSLINAADGRYLHTAVWTGSEMIVWGGANPYDLNTGGKYNPVTDSWTATSVTNAPGARRRFTAVWDDSGNEMIVWGGGEPSGDTNTGGRYCAQSGAPTPTPTPTPTAAPTPTPPTALSATNVTANSFTANWSNVGGATGYRLDVAKDSSFNNYVLGYQDLDVGNTTSRNVIGLIANTFYYYRVRAYNANGTSPNSNVITVKTKPH